MVQSATDAVPLPTRSRRRRTVPVIVLVTTLAGGLWWFLTWRSSLHLLVGYPVAGIGIQSKTVGQPEYYGGMAISQRVLDGADGSRPLDVDVSSVRPVVAVNTSHARVTVLRCRLAHDGGGPLGVGRAQIRSYCASLTPFTGGHVRLGGLKGQDDLVVMVTTRTAGKVSINGVRISYSAGWRHGSQHSGVQAKLVTAP